MQLAVSPLAPRAVKERTRQFTADFLTKSAPGSRLSLYDGFSTRRIAQITVPTLAYDSPRARALARGVRESFAAVTAFLQSRPDLPASTEPVINLPGLLRSLPPAEPDSVLVILGSGWHFEPRADSFSMRPGCLLPTDDHLLASPLESPYGLEGYANRLSGVKVIFATLGTPASDHAHEALRRFWAKAISLCGASLVAYTSDVNFALHSALMPASLARTEAPPLEPQGR